jgi:hypothetical protein
MAPTVTWIQFNQWSGCKIAGRTKVPLPATNLHMDRAYYLTAQLEAPLYGSVQSYDGAGMSGGPLHNIAVYPKSMEQGSMFPLLRHMQIGCSSQALRTLLEAYKTKNWFIAADGKLRQIQTGALITGREIRVTFTPGDGKVPRGGDGWNQAKDWALKHHEAFADMATFNAQKDFAIEYLKKTQASVEAKFYKSMNLDTLRVDEQAAPPTNNLTLEEDLAMCMYHSHSVNGPAPAASVLEAVTSKYGRGTPFAKVLIWSLGRKKFGRWEDTVDGANRYDRTRLAALKSGLWPREFFVGASALMPENLPGRSPV